jgi:hypothetical protein
MFTNLIFNVHKPSAQLTKPSELETWCAKPQMCHTLDPLADVLQDVEAEIAREQAGAE